MSKLGKEIFVGAIPVAIAFAIFIQLELLPLIIVIGLVLFVFYFTGLRGKIAMRSDRKIKQKKPGYITFKDIGGQSRQ